MIELRKCPYCKLSYSLNFFRDGRKQCRDCERRVQRENRRAKRLSGVKRFDETRLTTPEQKEAMLALHKNGWIQEKIARVFHMDQSRVSKYIKEAREL